MQLIFSKVNTKVNLKGLYNEVGELLTCNDSY